MHDHRIIILAVIPVLALSAHSFSAFTAPAALRAYVHPFRAFKLTGQLPLVLHNQNVRHDHIHQQQSSYEHVVCHPVSSHVALFTTLDPSSGGGHGDLSRKTNRLLTSFLRSLWKGVSQPFPALRDAMILPSSTNATDGTTFSVGLTFREGMLALIAYLSLGVFVYSFLLERWSIVDALYYTITVTTTLGYGDLCPTNPASKIFTCFFGMGGIAFLGAAVATVGARVVEAQIFAAETAQRESRKRLMRIFEDMPKVLGRFRKQSSDNQKKDLLEQAKTARQEQDESFSKVFRYRIKPLSSSSFDWILRSVVVRSLPSLSLMLVGGLIMRKLNGGHWSLVDSIFYSVITATTIGFGDLTPQTPAARLFAVLYIPLTIAAAGEFLSGITMALLRRRQRQVYERQLEKDLTIEHLKVMDANNDGKISREEYVQFMLIEMGRVSQNELDELFHQFDRLDVTASGYLDNEDLKLMAKLRGATVVE